MKKDNINMVFENLKNDFDLEQPNENHELRFLSKLNANTITSVTTKSLKSWVKPFLGIAASLVLVFTLLLGTQQNEAIKGLASVSPEMATTQNFFTNTINSELVKLQSENLPETQNLVEDAMKQLKILEQDYTKLSLNLSESGNDKRVIYAMITNFQNRIDVLQNVLLKIESVKQIKQSKNEQINTI